MPSVWTLKSLVFFLNAGKRKKKENVFTGRKTSALPRHQKKNSGEESLNEIVLPDQIWSMICEYSSPLDVLELRRVSRQLNKVVTSRLNSLIYFDVLRCDSTTLIEYNPGNDFYRVGRRNLYLHMDDRSAIVAIDSKWNHLDIKALWGSIQFFAPYARSLTIDSPLIELTAAALSSVKLTRFYAFICYVNAVSSTHDEELHIKCPKKTVHQKSLFPKLTEITIRVSSTDLSCLSRISDYGVDFDAIVETRLIELVRCAVLEPINRWKTERLGVRFGTKRPQHHLRALKDWIGADELKERYVQQHNNN